MSDRDRDRDRLLAGGVILLEYDPAWPERFSEAARAILDACGDLLLGVEHIGSTAVPGLVAKPVLDLMPVLRRQADGTRLAHALEPLGYEFRGEYGIPGRHYFVRQIEDDPHVWKHHVHAYELGHPERARHLVFRDALRADPALRSAYRVLKQRLARVHGDDANRYALAKGGFVDRAIARHGGPPRPDG